MASCSYPGQSSPFVLHILRRVLPTWFGASEVRAPILSPSRQPLQSVSREFCDEGRTNIYMHACMRYMHRCGPLVRAHIHTCMHDASSNYSMFLRSCTTESTVERRGSALRFARWIWSAPEISGIEQGVVRKTSCGLTGFPGLSGSDVSLLLCPHLCSPSLVDTSRRLLREGSGGLNLRFTAAMMSLRLLVVLLPALLLGVANGERVPGKLGQTSQKFELGRQQQSMWWLLLYSE